MKIPDDVRRTISDVAGKVVEKSQQLGKEAQLQVQLKKLQVEHARRIHELGKRTYAWYQSGTMVVSGPVPREVVDLCAQLDATQGKIEGVQREIEEVKLQASSTLPSASVASTPPALPAASTDASTARLDDSTKNSGS